MSDFISDEDMAKIEAESNFISDEDMMKMEADAPSALQSGLRGALQGVTMGLADEASGGIEALWEKAKGNPTAFGELYAQSRDDSRNKNKLAEEANPGSYTTGQIGGAIGTALIPGMGGASLGRLATQGAVQGFGSSDAEDAGQLAQDTAMGAGMGVAAFGAGKALQGGAKLVGKGLSKAGNAAAEGVESGSKKLLTKLGGVDDDIAGIMTGNFGDDAFTGFRGAAAKGSAKELEELVLDKLAKSGKSHMVTPDKISRGVDDIINSMNKGPKIDPLREIGAFGGLEYMVPGLGKVYAGVKGATTAYRAASNPQTVMKGYVAAEKATAITKEVLAKIAPAMGKYSQSLMDAAARGGTSLAATDFILGQTDPEYREMKNKALQEDNN